ncbi:helix-turn-helix domain-containing protein [Thermocaproicibacter melissae]|jgi:vacuolar-type H+-ATPase subunit E/Vma4|uniref:helix-turn-helix domain-containing protein n=1 Tax=Thermocaproicibacter melissae TaxID=2966552 RepID=UPI0024B25E45|nr:helix-turn-helix domain-containing protein [Thermocaproicibacter melissae]WBY63695.1 helix-turn-helix domain-containing protein [Thermocaproicibacter melissae]
MAKEEKRSYYAVIPANVRYDKSLSANAKLLYGEISALCNEKGYCWSTNKYFADLFGVSQTSISKWISSLVSKNYVYVKIVYREGTKEILERRMSIVKESLEEIQSTPPLEKKLNTPLEEKLNTPLEEKLKENNKETNITVINKSVSQFKEIGETDELTDEIRERLKKQIDYDYFEENYPEDLSGVDALIDCMAEMLTAPYTKINGIKLPRSILESYIRKTDSELLREFLEHMRGKKMRDIKNIGAYWQSAFINFIKESELVRLTI